MNNKEIKKALLLLDKSDTEKSLSMAEALWEQGYDLYAKGDMVLFFNDPRSGELDDSVLSISKLCDQHSVPMATNVATAELLIHGLARGDLDWREVMNPNRIPFAI